MSRRERRSVDPKIIARRQELAGQSGLIGPPQVGTAPGTADGGGWGIGSPKSKPATGQQPIVNPFMIPKGAGLNIISQTYPSNYYVPWDMTTWRSACDQVMKMGYPAMYATMVAWAYECSPFIQSLFTKYGSAIDEVPFFAVDGKGNKMDDWTEELCNKPWEFQLRRELVFAYLWGFSGLNFDPGQETIYKYPMQDIDPINRMLRKDTFSFYEGFRFEDSANLLFVQPSTSYESFLGWMQPITRSFINMNVNKTNWISAGLRLAVPLLTVGYPQNDGSIDSTSGRPINAFKMEAEDIAANINPRTGLVYPYTVDMQGNIQKAIQIDFSDTKAGQNMYKIYSEFNEDEKNEIRELVLGGTLSSSGSKSGSGSRSLGEVHERMFQEAVEAKLRSVTAVLNTDWRPKIERFYKIPPPKGWKIVADRTKQLTLVEMTDLSGVLTASGKRFTDDFFEANGISRDFFEDAPAPAPGGAAQIKPQQDPDPNVSMAEPEKSFFGVKKKYRSARNIIT